MRGEVHGGYHRTASWTLGVINHRDTAIALLDGPDVGGLQAQQPAQDGLVDRVVGHHKGRFIGAEAGSYASPGH